MCCRQTHLLCGFYPLNEFPTIARREQFEFDWQPVSTEHQEAVHKSVRSIFSLVEENKLQQQSRLLSKSKRKRNYTAIIKSAHDDDENRGSGNADVDSV